jgi:hypothetical protein
MQLQPHEADALRLFGDIAWSIAGGLFAVLILTILWAVPSLFVWLGIQGHWKRPTQSTIALDWDKIRQDERAKSHSGMKNDP